MNVTKASKYYGMSRQNFYQQRERKQQKVNQDCLIVEMVLEIRKHHPRMGGRKLYFLLRDTIEGLNMKVGRDVFFDVLRANGLLVEPKKSFVITTRSFTRFYRHKDHYNNKQFSKANSAWVSDITYIRVDSGFKYLSLITDAYSRKIIGWQLGDSLETKWTLKALQKALKQAKVTEGIVHHSDRGFQYTSKAYTQLLEKNKMLISMGECGNCYDNAKAERVNGILKIEYLLDSQFKTNKEAEKAVEQAIKLYNKERPHLSLDYKTPQQVHLAA
jgi:transposase InsO family protein